MSDKKSFYITTTLPYVNAEPHIGFAHEILVGDVVVRSKTDQEVFFNTGTDEHGQKIFEAAQKVGEDVIKYVNHYAEEFKKLQTSLGLSDKLHFIRTTDEGHIQAAQEMWKRCDANGDIELREYEGLYCVGCERFLAQRDLIDGKCHIHGTEPRLVKEKNYFFKFKKYEQKLLEYLNNPDVIIPEHKREEAINFVKEGLENFSISREKTKLSWGIPVPGDDTQVMYVWFDALTSYISTLGWPDESGDFKKFWVEGETVQLAGKDQVRFQSLMWQAMLMSAGIKKTGRVIYHGFINSGGQKMSKSIGNVISPYELVKKYGTEATRYLLLRHIHSTEDTDVTWEKLDEWYEADLVNGLGNLVARIMKMAEDYLENPVTTSTRESVEKQLSEFKLNEAISALFAAVGLLDLEIQTKEPFKLIKTDAEKARQIISALVKGLSGIASALIPFMPQTSEKILNAIKENKKPENLFPRLNA